MVVTTALGVVTNLVEGLVLAQQVAVTIERFLAILKGTVGRRCREWKPSDRVNGNINKEHGIAVSPP